MNPIEITKQEEGNYYLPCGSPFQNIRPMTPIDNVILNLYHTMANLSDDIIYQIQQYTFNRLNNFNQYTTYDADHVDDHHKDDFQSISEKEDIKEQIKENINVESKEVVKDETKVHIKKDDDEKDDDDDEEVSKVNSGSESGSEPCSESDSEQDNFEPKSEPKSETKYEPKNSKAKVDTINTTFIFGKIVSKDKDSKAKVLLDDERIGYFPTNFKYYGEIGDKVRVSIKPENKDKKILILNFINKHFEIGDEVTGIVSINDSNVIYVNVPGIKMASFPKKFNHPGLKDDDKVSCTIFKTFDYTDKHTNNIVGIGANLTFNSKIIKF
jgi:hypothetical protein